MRVCLNTMVKNESKILDNVLPIWRNYPVDFFIFYDDNSTDNTVEVIKKYLPIDKIMGKSEVLKPLHPESFTDEKFGVITVKDLLQELEKPGRDPRGNFKVARFNEGIEDIKDLQVGMVLSGTVSNVAAFGAFVDLGVHQDGLIHVSQLSHKFITDAREVVRTGDVVKVKVLEVDQSRQRISLTMKLDVLVQSGANAKSHGLAGQSHTGQKFHAKSQSNLQSGHKTATAMEAAFAKFKK